MTRKQLAEAFPFLDRWLRLRQEFCQLPGLSVAIRKKGELVFSRTYGMANLEDEVALKPSHLFRVASHSKSVTAVAIMQLVEAGKLQLDDLIADYLPWLKKHSDNRIGEITVRQLLCHNAGLLRDGMEAAFWELEKPFLDAVQLKKAVIQSELVFDPDTRMKYSNIGYSLLGSLIEGISGKSYNQYVRDHIISVLGLSKTKPEFERSIEKDLATGYSRSQISSKRIPIEHSDTRAMSAATGLCSTAEELSQFYSALLLGTGLLLSDRSKREIQRTQCKVSNSPNKYGLGVIIESFKQRKLFGHGGGFPGHKSYTLCDQSEELVIVAMTNAIEVVPEDIATGVLSVIDYFAKSKPSRRPKDRLGHFQGTIMNMWRLIDIVALGDKAVAIYPNKWMPFGYVEDLEYVDKSTLKIAKAEGYGSEGELIRFQFGKNGAITSVRYGGWLMWPEVIYRERLKGRDSFGLREHHAASR